MFVIFLVIIFLVLANKFDLIDLIFVIKVSRLKHINRDIVNSV